jgi:hypothetical protein
VANEPRPVTAADLEAIVDLGFARCGWRPTSQEPWRIQGLRASENGQQDDDLLMSFYAEDIDRVGDALDKDDMRSGLFPYLRGEDASGRVDLNEDVGALTAGGVHPSKLPLGCSPGKSPLVTAQQFEVNTIFQELTMTARSSWRAPSCASTKRARHSACA